MNKCEIRVVTGCNLWRRDVPFLLLWIRKEWSSLTTDPNDEKDKACKTTGKGAQYLKLHEQAEETTSQDQKCSERYCIVIIILIIIKTDWLTKVSQYRSIWLAPLTSKKLLIVLQFCHSYGFLPSRIFQSASSELKHFYWISDRGRQNNNIVLSSLVFCTRQNILNSIQFNSLIKRAVNSTGLLHHFFSRGSRLTFSLNGSTILLRPTTWDW